MPGRRPGVPHCRRPRHPASFPIHVTLRSVAVISCLRAENVFPAVRAALTNASRRGFRVVQFSVQENHVHILVEADDAAMFTHGVRGVTIRVARAVNRALGRRGAVWGDRYHARALTTPRAVRHALVYVLMNRRKHRPDSPGMDPCSSAPWFPGWRQPLRPAPSPNPVVPARTWLASVGWRRHGLIGLEERPRAPA